MLCDDVDQDLPSLLRKGVPTESLNTIKPSSVWRDMGVPNRPNLALQLFDTPRGSAVEDCSTACERVEDVQAGFASWLDGGLEEAQARIGTNCAAGRLGVVKKKGSAPRLIRDSSGKGRVFFS